MFGNVGFPFITNSGLKNRFLFTLRFDASSVSLCIIFASKFLTTILLIFALPIICRFGFMVKLLLTIKLDTTMSFAEIILPLSVSITKFLFITMFPKVGFP